LWLDWSVPEYGPIVVCIEASGYVMTLYQMSRSEIPVIMTVRWWRLQRSDCIVTEHITNPGLLLRDLAHSSAKPHTPTGNDLQIANSLGWRKIPIGLCQFHVPENCVMNWFWKMWRLLVSWCKSLLLWWIHFHPICLKSILVLSSHLLLGLSSWLFTSSFAMKMCAYFHYSWFDHLAKCKQRNLPYTYVFCFSSLCT
jgi:hypothetical protein